MAIEFAERIRRIPVYPVASGYALEGDVALLASNESPFEPLPEVLEAAANAMRGANRYPDPTCSTLRKALADRYEIPPSRIAIGNGSCDALLAAGEALLEPGAEFVYAWPSFSVYPHITAASGATGITVPLDAEHRHDLDAMRAEITAATRLVIVCNPNNPTSTAHPLDAIAAFLDQVPRSVCVILDEAYCEFGTLDDPDASLDLLKRHSNLVLLRTFSKAHGLAGLRVGYSVSNPELTQHLRVAATPFAVSQIAENAAVTSLQNFSQVVERVQSLVDERDRVTAGLRELGWFVPDAQGNFVWLNLGENSAEFAALAGEQALSVRAFGNEGVRVSIGETEANTRFLELCANYTNPPRRS